MSSSRKRDVEFAKNRWQALQFARRSIKELAAMMTFITFDARVRSDHLIGFYIPTNVAGSSASFTITITAPGTATAPGKLYAIVSFGAPIPPNRHIVFTTPPAVPLGMAHFLVLITTAQPAQAVYQIKAAPAKKPKKKRPKSSKGKR
jgi:hypothetical protein